MKTVNEENFEDLYDKLYVSVDCVVFGYDFTQSKLNVLVFKRPYYPLKDESALIGGFVSQNESVDDSSKRILTEFTGIDRAFLEQFSVYGNLNRALKRVVSIAYWGFIKVLDSDKETLEKHNAYWVPVDSVPDLIFDHNKMITDALTLLKNSIKYRPVGFELLPEKFTIPQLFNIYTEIYGAELDVRNFSRKMKSLGILDKLEEKQNSGLGRKAFLHRFNKEKYTSLLSQGFYLDLE
ncbi:DNA mismatch repair protein MutT [Flavobacteriaceae bacterium]|nr:DNA mismatch repair protein MutT [Flavobacteriaceae bacterium]